mgnify:CR=1 FL=1
MVHNSNDTLDYLETEFETRIISKRYYPNNLHSIQWPPHR